MTYEISITLRCRVPDEHRFLNLKAVADDVATNAFVQLESFGDHGVSYEDATVSTHVVEHNPGEPVTPLAWPFFEIPDWQWEPNGDDSDPTSRLNAACHINNTPMHVEARAVMPDDDPNRNADVMQELVGEYAEDYDLLIGLAGEAGEPFYTTHIPRFGRDYLVFAYAFYD